MSLELQAVALVGSREEVSWALESNENYFVASLYRKINQGPTLAPAQDLSEKLNCHLKLKSFFGNWPKEGCPPANKFQNAMPPRMASVPFADRLNRCLTSFLIVFSLSFRGVPFSVY
jgi:hypothetical protein